MIISLNAREVFNKSQNSFFMKTLNRIRIYEYFFNDKIFILQSKRWNFISWMNIRSISTKVQKKTAISSSSLLLLFNTLKNLVWFDWLILSDFVYVWQCCKKKLKITFYLCGWTIPFLQVQFVMCFCVNMFWNLWLIFEIVAHLAKELSIWFH